MNQRTKELIGALLEIDTETSQQETCEFPYTIGANYFIRTATYHHTGKLIAVTEHELVLESACWIADSGRFQQALDTCKFDEVEPFPPDKTVIIGRGALIDAVQIDSLPTSQK